MTVFERSRLAQRALVGWGKLAPYRRLGGAGRLRQLGSSNGALAIVDQALVSGVNFATTLLLLRYLSTTQAGYYTLVFASVLAVTMVQSTLITSPLMVFAPRLAKQQRGHYFNSLWVVQLVGSAIVSVAIIIAMLTYEWWRPGLITTVGILPLVLVVTTYLTQEFVRRMLFVQRRGLSALGVDLLSYGLQFVALVMLIVLQKLTLSSTIWAMGLTSLVACLFGVLQLRPVLGFVTREDIGHVWRQHWEHGRWLAASALAYWSSNQIYLFIVAFMISPAAAAVLNAARTMLGFTHIFLHGLENFVPALVTRQLVNDGPDAMVRWLGKFRVVMVTIVGINCIVVAAFAEPLMRLVLGEQYANASVIVLLFAVAYFIMPFTFLLAFALRAMDAPRLIFHARLAAAVVTLVISVPLVALGGVTGAAIGLVITYVIVYVFVRAGYSKSLKAVRAAS